MKYTTWNFSQAHKYDFKTWKTNFDISTPLSGAFPPFFSLIADSKDFHSYQDLQNEVYDLKLWSHTQVW